MTIKFEATDLLLIEGAYYTSPFSVIKSGITVQVKTDGVSTIVIESSIDGIDWFPIDHSEFNTEATGDLQSYNECQLDLLYRIKSSIEPISIKILL